MSEPFNAEVLSPSSTARVDPPEERPGALRGGAVLTLHTRQAQRLVKGRSHSAAKPAIIGLIGFANLARSVWHGARADDPFADWWMLQVHEALVQAEKALSQLALGMASCSSGMSALEVAPPSSVKPARVILNFSNPYAFRAAHLIGVLDGLTCKVLSARHVGLLTRDDAGRLLQQAGREVRRALQSPVGYRFLGVTRRDVAQGTAKASQAREAMGELPDDVLTASRRAPHAPAVAQSPHGSPLSDPARLSALPSLG